MLELFRTLILALAIAAPGQVGCNRPIAQATVCWVTFSNPGFVEYIRPTDASRIFRLIEIKRDERAGK